MRAKPDRAPVGRRTVRACAVTPSHAIRGVAGVAAFIIVLGLLIAPPVPDLSDNFSREFASLAPSRVAPLSFISAAQAQTDTLANSPSDPVRAYHNALDRFKSILRERRAQIDSNRQLPNLPGQALYGQKFIEFLHCNGGVVGCAARSAKPKIKLVEGRLGRGFDSLAFQKMIASEHPAQRAATFLDQIPSNPHEA